MPGRRDQGNELDETLDWDPDAPGMTGAVRGSERLNGSAVRRTTALSAEAPDAESKGSNESNKDAAESEDD
jgi:hypothetical protein